MKRRNVFLAAGATVMMTAGMLFTAEADDVPGKVDCEAVALDGEWKEYHLDINTYAYCPVTLEENGCLSVSIQTCFENFHYVDLLDANYEKIDYSSVYGNGSADPQTTNFQYDLAAGTYYCVVESWNDCEGTFRIQGTFTASQASETEPNDSFDQPAACEPDETVRGFLSSAATDAFWSDAIAEGKQDMVDIYRFSCEEGEYELSLVSAKTEGGSFYYCLYDEGREELDSAYVNGTERKVLEDRLSEGTYYIKIEPTGDDAGDYLFCVSSDQANMETEQEVVEEVSETETATAQAEPESEMGESSAASLPSSGNYTETDVYQETIKLMEGTYVAEDQSMQMEIAVDERYEDDPQYHDFTVDVTYYDENGEISGTDSYNLENQGMEWGNLYNLQEDQENMGYNIIKTDDSTIQMRLDEQVICELYQIEETEEEAE